MDGQLVSITVFCGTSSRCLVPWTVIRAGPTDSFCDILKGGQYGTIELNSWLNEADGVERVLVRHWDRYEHVLFISLIR